MKLKKKFILVAIVSVGCCIQVATGSCMLQNEKYIQIPNCCSGNFGELSCGTWKDIWQSRNGDYYGLIVKTFDTESSTIKSFPPIITIRLQILRIEHTELARILPNSTKDFNYLKEAYLSHNRITKIENNVFANMMFLELVDLSYNGITTIDVRAFFGDHNLKYLYLNNNNISEMSTSVFTGLESLVTLDISNNPIKQFSILPTATRKLPSMTYFGEYGDEYDSNDDSNNEQIFPSLLSFSSTPQSQNVLKALKTVNMTNTNLDSSNSGIVLSRCGINLSEISLGENVISKINVMVFSGLYVLEKLNLSYNVIDSIDDGSFDGMQKLTTLLLNNNHIKLLPKMIFAALKSLLHLNLSNNPITRIHEYFLGGFLRLNVLEMSNVSMTQTNTEFFKHVRCNVFNVSHNNIQSIRQNTFKNFIRLASLDLSFNVISDLDDLAFSSVPNLENVYLGHNQLSQIPRSLFADESKLHILDFSNNPITNFSFSIIENAENLREIYLNSLKIQKFSMESVSKMKEKMEIISVSGNYLMNIDSTTFSNCTSLLYLDISHNSINSIEDSALFDNYNLLKFSAQNNHLKFISTVLFRDTSSLEYLDLSNNEINVILAGTFDSCGNLRVLNLSYNHLQRLNRFSTYPLKNLEQLYLQNNRLDYIEGAEYLESLKVVSLRSNPWKCDDLHIILERLDNNSRNKNNNSVDNPVYVHPDLTIPASHHRRQISCDYDEIILGASENSQGNLSDVNDLLRSINFNFKNMMNELRSSHFPSNNSSGNIALSAMPRFEEDLDNLVNNMNRNFNKFLDQLNTSHHSNDNFREMFDLLNASQTSNHLEMNRLLQDIDMKIKLSMEANHNQSVLGDMLDNINSNLRKMLEIQQNSANFLSDPNFAVSSKLVGDNDKLNNSVSRVGNTDNLKFVFYMDMFLGLGIICISCVMVYFMLRRRKRDIVQEEHQLIDTRM